MNSHQIETFTKDLYTAHANNRFQAFQDLEEDILKYNLQQYNLSS